MSARKPSAASHIGRLPCSMYFPTNHQPYIKLMMRPSKWWPVVSRHPWCITILLNAGNGQVKVAGGYEILKHVEAAFVVASYDLKRPLLIEPTREEEWPRQRPERSLTPQFGLW